MLNRGRPAVEITGPTFNGVILVRSQQEATNLANWICGWRSASPPDVVGHAVSDAPWPNDRRWWRRVLQRALRR